MKPVIIDCDPGHDDAIALMLALGSQSLDVRLITVVAGNSLLEKTLNNALKVVSVTGHTVEIAAGCEKPMLGNNAPDLVTHGISGLDGPDLPPPTFEASHRTALEAQVAILGESREKITLIATGPLTNIAVLIQSHPEVKRKIERIVIMGGACFGGNWTPKAEYNIFLDPEAAEIVFQSGIPITMCGLDVTLKTQVFPEEFEKFRNIGNKCGTLVAELLDFFHKSTTPNFLSASGEREGAHMHDVCAVAYVLAPEIFVTKTLNVQIERSGDLTRGSTVVDYNGVYDLEPNADVCFDIQRQEFLDLLYKAIARLD